MKKIFLTSGLVVAVLVLAGIGLAYYMGYFEKDTTRSPDPVFVNRPADESLQPDGDSTQSLSEETTPSQPLPISEIDYKIEPVLGNLSIPWSVVFTDLDRMLITERDGAVRVAQKSSGSEWQLQDQPIHVFDNVSTQSEEGLMGMTLDPGYQSNKFIYLCYAYPENDKLWDRVVRMTDMGDSLANQQIIIDKIPSARFHAGCELGFGPDGKFYISTGDASNRDQAQDRKSLAGKILRLNSDGSIPSDNPFEDSPIYSFGHRNPQGFDWHPENSLMYASEHGPSGNDGPGGGDEINLIEKGQNYGWPVVSHQKTQRGMVDPKLVFTPAIAPGSLTFHAGGKISEFNNNIFVGLLKGTGILRVVLDPSDPTQILWYERVPEVDFGRIREVTMGPDGYLYFTTSNQDGRGVPASNDDRIFRIVEL